MTKQTDSPTGIRSLFSELRRRRVLRTSAIYIAASWVLLQVINVVFPIFEIEDRYQKYVTIGLVLGFPVSVVLSWLFNSDLGKITRDSSMNEQADAADSRSSDTDINFPNMSLGLSVIPI